jgi:hypothetical protein
LQIDLIYSNSGTSLICGAQQIHEGTTAKRAIFITERVQLYFSGSKDRAPTIGDLPWGLPVGGNRFCPGSTDPA